MPGPLWSPLRKTALASHLPSGTRSASRSSRTPRAGPCASLGHLKANAGVRPHWLSHRSRWTDADSVPLDDNYSDLGHLGNEPPGQERRCAASPRLRPAHDRPCLLPVPAPWRQAHPRPLQSLAPTLKLTAHSDAHGPQTHALIPIRLRVGPGKGRCLTFESPGTLRSGPQHSHVAPVYRARVCVLSRRCSTAGRQ